MLDGFAFFATAAFEVHTARFLFLFGEGGKVDAPKVDIGVIHKSHAVSVDFAFRTDAADNANESFFVGVEIADDDFLLGGELIGGNDASAVAAEEHGFGHFREAFAIHVASGQKDSELFGDAAAAAQVFVGHDMHSSREAVLKARLTGRLRVRYRNWGRGSTGAMGDGGILRRARASPINITGKQRPMDET